jgi:predicted enzyme related to lactoylglutathione lyase
MAQTAEKIDANNEECAGETGMGSHGSFCWNELLTHDPARAKKFYADTIGWSFDPMPMQDGGTYWVAKQGDKMVGGIFEMRGECFAEMPENWMPYLAVDDVDARVKKATAAGATLMRPLFDIPGIGRIAILRQPGGERMACGAEGAPRQRKGADQGAR